MRQRIIQYLESLISLLRQDKPTEERQPVSSIEVVDRIINRPIAWVDWRNLPIEQRRRWSNDAKSVLSNEAFRSLCGSRNADGSKTNGEMVKDLIEHIARYSKSHAETENLRMTINGIELIRERLEEMVFEESPTTQQDIHSTI